MITSSSSLLVLAPARFSNFSRFTTLLCWLSCGRRSLLVHLESWDDAGVICIDYFDSPRREQQQQTRSILITWNFFERRIISTWFGRNSEHFSSIFIFARWLLWIKISAFNRLTIFPSFEQQQCVCLLALEWSREWKEELKLKTSENFQNIIKWKTIEE